MATFKITIAYDGTGFVGWQRQARGPSIQGVIEEALSALDGRTVAVHGAGRTDAGVHALAQVASFTLVRDLDADAVMRATNARLPASVRIVSAATVDAAFHARHCARGKRYAYRILNGDVPDVFARAYVWHVRAPLDVGAMNAAARQLEGRHDFAAFQASGAATITTEREIFRIEILTTKNTNEGLGAGRELMTVQIAGDGFLRHMVRIIVGSLVEIGRGRRDCRWLGRVLASGDRRLAGPTAPAHALFLLGVDYPSDVLADEC